LVVEAPEKINPSYRASRLTLAVRQVLYVKVLDFLVLVIIADKGVAFISMFKKALGITPGQYFVE
jgi:hypothetical protein